MKVKVDEEGKKVIIELCDKYEMHYFIVRLSRISREMNSIKDNVIYKREYAEFYNRLNEIKKTDWFKENYVVKQNEKNNN